MGNGVCMTANDAFFWGVMFGVFVVPVIRKVADWCVNSHRPQ